MKHRTLMMPLQQDLAVRPECADPEKETVLRFGPWVLCAGCAHETFVFLGDPCTREDPCSYCRRLEQEQFDAYAASVVAADSRSREHEIDPWCPRCDGLRDDDSSEYCAKCRAHDALNG